MWGRNGIGEASREEGVTGYPSLGIPPLQQFSPSLHWNPIFSPVWEEHRVSGGRRMVTGPLVPLRPVFVVSAAGFVRGFHISLVLFMNIIFFLHAHSSFQTFGQAAPCLVQAWVWLQSCLFFLFSLFSLK